MNATRSDVSDHTQRIRKDGFTIYLIIFTNVLFHPTLKPVAIYDLKGSQPPFFLSLPAPFDILPNRTNAETRQSASKHQQSAYVVPKDRSALLTALLFRSARTSCSKIKTWIANFTFAVILDDKRVGRDSRGEASFVFFVYRGGV